MREFKVSEVRLRGRGFTLFPACKNKNVSKKLANSILWAMNISAQSVGKEGILNFKIQESDPLLPNLLSKENFVDENVIEECIEEGLIKKLSEENYELTEKMISVLEEAAQKQNELDKSGFHFCPCRDC